MDRAIRMQNEVPKVTRQWNGTAQDLKAAEAVDA